MASTRRCFLPGFVVVGCVAPGFILLGCVVSGFIVSGFIGLGFIGLGSIKRTSMLFSFLHQWFSFSWSDHRSAHATHAWSPRGRAIGKPGFHLTITGARFIA